MANMSWEQLKALGLEYEVMGGEAPEGVREKPVRREDAFQDRVIRVAHLYKWKVAHFRPAQTKDGWRTPVSGDGKGFPDLLMINEQRKVMVVAELKCKGNKPSEDQEMWLSLFRLVCPHVYVWYPEDEPTIERLLSGEIKM